MRLFTCCSSKNVVENVIVEGAAKIDEQIVHQKRKEGKPTSATSKDSGFPDEERDSTIEMDEEASHRGDGDAVIHIG